MSAKAVVVAAASAFTDEAWPAFGSFQRSQVPFDVSVVGRKAIHHRYHLSYDGIYWTLTEKSIESEDVIAAARERSRTIRALSVPKLASSSS